MLFLKPTRSKANADAAAGQDIVLITRGKRSVQIWIAGKKIANLGSQAEEPKQPIIQTATEIEHAAIQKLIRCVLAIRQFCGLLIEGITSADSDPRRQTRAREKLQPNSGSDVERSVVLRDGCSCGGQTSVGEGHGFEFAIKRCEFCIPKTMSVR